MLDTTDSARATVRRILDGIKAEGRDSLTAPEGKLVCDAYGISVPKEGLAHSADEAVKLAAGMGKVVLKIVSPDILHKTEAGGVLVGLSTPEEIRHGYDTILANAKKYKADAKIVGVQVQQMVGGGQEVIVGAVTDGSFGKLVAFGMGGVLVEVLKDITFRLAPATTTDALSMLDGIQAAEMLKGVRGSDPGEPRGAVHPDRARVRADQRLPRDLRDGPEPGVRVQGRRHRRRRADRRGLQPARRTVRARRIDDVVSGMNRIMRPDSVAVIGAECRGRQDRQLRDEEPGQRRLQGEDLPDPPEGGRRSWATRPTSR